MRRWIWLLAVKNVPLFVVTWHLKFESLSSSSDHRKSRSLSLRMRSQSLTTTLDYEVLQHASEAAERTVGLSSVVLSCLHDYLKMFGYYWPLIGNHRRVIQSTHSQWSMMTKRLFVCEITKCYMFSKKHSWGKRSWYCYWHVENHTGASNSAISDDLKKLFISRSLGWYKNAGNFPSGWWLHFSKYLNGFLTVVWCWTLYCNWLANVTIASDLRLHY